MKKLNLKKLLNLQADQLLERDEIKAIIGGYGGLGNSKICTSSSDCQGHEICCGPPGGTAYCQACPCGQVC